MLRWIVARDGFLFTLTLPKLLMSWYLESIQTRWSELLKAISKELHFLKTDLRLLSSKMLVSLEKQKPLKPKFIKGISEFDWSKNGHVFDRHFKHIHMIFSFEIFE